MACIRAALLLAGLALFAAEAHGAAPPLRRADPLADRLPAVPIARLFKVRLRHPSHPDIASIAFSPDSRTLATGGAAGVYLWDANTGGQLRDLSAKDLDFACGVSFSPDGRQVAAGYYADDTGNLFVWDAATGKLLRSYAGHKGLPLATAFVDHGRILLSVGEDGKVCWWDVASGKRLRELDLAAEWRDPKSPTRFRKLIVAALAPDGSLVATRVVGTTADGKRTAQAVTAMWHLGRRKQAFRFERLGGRPAAIARRGGHLACITSSRGVEIYSAATGKFWKRLELPDVETVADVAFSDDGTLAAVAYPDFGVRLWDLRLDNLVRRFCPPIAPPEIGPPRLVLTALSPDARRLALTKGPQIYLWDTRTGKEIPGPPELSYPVDHLRFSADGKLLLSCSQATSPPYAGEAVRWNTKNWKQLSRRKLESNVSAAPVPISPDHRLMVRRDKAGDLLVCERAGGKVLRKLQLSYKEDGVPGGFFSPSNSFLVMPLDHGQTCWLLDVATGKEVLTLPKHIDENCLAFSPGDKAVAWYEKEDLVLVAEAATGKVKRRFRATPRPPGPHPEWAAALRFSPDNRFLAAWDHYGKAVVIWDLQTGNERHRLPGKRPHSHATYRVRLAYSPDGRTLGVLNTAGGCHVELWELATGELRQRVRGHRVPLKALAFSPDSRLLATGGEDVIVLIWDLTGHAFNGRPGVARFTPKQLNDLWDRLAEADPGRAHAAVWSLVAAPKDAVGLLRRLRPYPWVPKERIDRLLNIFDSYDRADREEATEGLEKMGEAAVPALRAALAKNPPPELRRRLARLLAQVRPRVPTAEQLRAVRAAEVLEQIATPDARALLKSLAEGARGAWITEEASAALRRLSARAKGAR
jgi:WD40 repeat protein